MTTEIASPIRTIRREKGLTAEQLAAKAGLASATVYRAERGIGSPSDETLAEIARVLGVEVAQLHEPEDSTSDASGGTNHNAEAPTSPPAVAAASDGVRAGAR